MEEGADPHRVRRLTAKPGEHGLLRCNMQNSARTLVSSRIIPAHPAKGAHGASCVLAGAIRRQHPETGRPAGYPGQRPVSTASGPGAGWQAHLLPSTARAAQTRLERLIDVTDRACRHVEPPGGWHARSRETSSSKTRSAAGTDRRNRLPASGAPGRRGVATPRRPCEHRAGYA